LVVDNRTALVVCAGKSWPSIQFDAMLVSGTEANS
jgi:hypothetical protein